jgi:hypothetical protein
MFDIYENGYLTKDEGLLLMKFEKMLNLKKRI